MNRQGFTFVEVLVALAIVALMLLVLLPAFSTYLERARHEGAVRQLMTDVRDARARAVSTGWEYRIVGYGADASVAQRNQYRILARRSTAVAWPAVTAAPFDNDTQRAEGWIDVTSLYPGVRLDYTAAQFQLTFDARGTASTANATFNPLQVIAKDGTPASLTVSLVGGVRTD